MSRNEKLYGRLVTLANDYKELIIGELEEISKGSTSRYFGRKAHLFKYGPKSVGKYWQDKETATIEKLEKEILSLSQKLDAPSFSYICNLVDTFIEEREKLKDRFNGGEESLARNYIEKIKKQEI